MPSQFSLSQIIEFVGGGPDASFASLVLRGFLICCTVVALGQLVTMWSTQWGDRNLLSKSLVLSVLFHLCLGLGWATVIETAPVVADSIVETEPISVRLIAESPSTASVDDFAPQQYSTGSMTQSTLGQISQTSRRTLRERPTADTGQPTLRSERPSEMTLPTPTEPLRDVAPKSPVLEQLEVTTTTARVVSEVKEAALPNEVRTEATTTARSRMSPTRVGSLVPTPGEPPSQPNPTFVPRLTPTPAPTLNNDSRPGPAPVPVAMSPRIDHRATISTPYETKGTLRGVVTDAATGLPIAGTTIRFDRAQGKPLMAITREDGSYDLILPGTPDTFVITASQEGYVPDARNMRASDVAAKTGRLDFRLRVSTDNVIVLEQQPVVHHLGNDQFEGRANSRFQRQSEGATITVAFDVTETQLKAPSNSTAVSFSAKGVQCAPHIWVNGRRLAGTKDLTPADGSYGDLVYPFDRSWLRAGRNEVKISATICNGDLDDFEFVNVQVRLAK